MTRIAGLVLAGGSAKRMGGGDKPLLPIAGRPMIARILETLGGELEAVAISANGDPARFAAFGRPVLPDGAFVGEGPLAGLLAGLDWAAAEGYAALLTVPGDTPFIPHGLAAMLSPAPACIVEGNQTHHLIALWPTVARAELHRLFLTTGSRSVTSFSSRIAMRYVQAAAGQIGMFTNVNTPQELAAARSLAENTHDADGGDRGAGRDRTAVGSGD